MMDTNKRQTKQVIKLVYVHRGDFFIQAPPMDTVALSISRLCREIRRRPSGRDRAHCRTIRHALAA